MIRVLIIIMLGILLVAFATRVETVHYPSLEIGAAAGWLSTDDGRQFPLKGTNTVNKFGFCDDLDGTEEAVWDIQELGGPSRCFTILGTMAQAVYLSSDDENDASDNNAVSITVEYLDSAWATKTLVVPLGAAVASGTASVQIGTGSILRIQRMFATSTAAVGNVYASIDDDAGVDGVPDDPANQIIAGITIGANQTLQACYTVPIGFDALMTKFTIANASNAGAIRFQLRRSVEGAASRISELHPVANNLLVQIDHQLPIRFVEKTDIEITGIGASPNNDASATFDLLLIPNTD